MRATAALGARVSRWTVLIFIVCFSIMPFAPCLNSVTVQTLSASGADTCRGGKVTLSAVVKATMDGDGEGGASSREHAWHNNSRPFWHRRGWQAARLQRASAVRDHMRRARHQHPHAPGPARRGEACNSGKHRRLRTHQWEFRRGHQPRPKKQQPPWFLAATKGRLPGAAIKVRCASGSASALAKVGVEAVKNLQSHCLQSLRIFPWGIGCSAQHEIASGRREREAGGHAGGLNTHIRANLW